jgi:hypothetical protein
LDALTCQRASRQLDVWAQQNVQIDLKAKQHISVATALPRHFSIAGEPWQLWVQEKKITRDIQTTIYGVVQEKDSELYWSSKKDVDPLGIPLVDWQTIGCSMKQIPRARRTFIMKHTSGMCGVGKYIQRWKEWDTDACPRCGQPEDSIHVWMCKGPGTEEIWNKVVTEVEHLLSTLETDPTLKFLIITYLKGWYSGDGIQYEAPRQFHAILQAQQLVGWSRFFEGWLVKAWRVQQQRYYDLIKSAHTGRRWATAIVLKLWGIAWDMWEHRNGILHDKENLITRSMGIQLNARASRIYTDLSSRALRHNDRHLVHLLLYALLRKDVNYKISWLSVAEPALRDG